MSGGADDIPRDAKIIAQILQSVGIDEYEPRVIPQLLEFMYRYTTDVLNDSVTYAAHAGRSDKIALDDVKLAIKTQLNYSFTIPPPRDVLLEIVSDRNDQVIPIIPARAGVLLPRDELCLTNPNYQVEPQGIVSNNSNNGSGNNGGTYVQRQAAAAVAAATAAAGGGPSPAAAAGRKHTPANKRIEIDLK